MSTKKKHPTDSGAKIVCSGQALGEEIFRRIVLVSSIKGALLIHHLVASHIHSFASLT